MKEKRKAKPEKVGDLSEEAKKFFSAGGSFSIPACATAVGGAWYVLELISAYCKNTLVGLALSLIVVYAYAYVPREPEGHANAGKRKLTRHEFMFGIINALLVLYT